MNPVAYDKFHQALELCNPLSNIEGKLSTIPCECIHLLCEVTQEPLDLLELCQEHTEEIEEVLSVITNYAASVDNWKVEDCPFGIKDHCNILYFLLNVHTKQFEFFRGRETFTPEVICELLKEWKGIDLNHLIKGEN